MALTDKQLAFIDEYVKDFNATQAAIRAGYSEKTAYNIGWENVRKREIADALSKRLSERHMLADEVLARLAEQARANMSDFLKFEEGIKLPFLDLKSANDKGLLRLVKKFKYNAAGHPEIELYDAQAALVHIGKAHGLFNNDAGSSDDKPFIVKVVYGDKGTNGTSQETS